MQSKETNNEQKQRAFMPIEICTMLQLKTHFRNVEFDITAQQHAMEQSVSN